MTPFAKWKMKPTLGRLKVLVVYKKSRLEHYSAERETFGFDRLVDQGELSLRFLQEGHDLHQECLALVQRVLTEHGAEVATCYREDLSAAIADERLIVTVGGDGTALDASHYLDSQILLGVNSDPSRSVGSLCAASSQNFSELLGALLDGRLEVQPIARIEGKLDGKPLPMSALNEFLIVHENPAAMCRYALNVQGVNEEHKSSGIWVCAPAGSTGATFSAGGRVQDLNDDRLQWLVREPYYYDAASPRLLSGFARSGEIFNVTSRMPGGQIYIDGPHHRVPFSMGSKLELSAGGQPLHLCVTPELLARRQSVAIEAKEKRFAC